MMNSYEEIRGYLRIQITGMSPERFINLCKNKEIKIWNVQSFYQGFYLNLSIKDFKKLKGIVKKTKTKIRIEERNGLPFFFYRYRRRTPFYIGVFLAIILLVFCSFFVWKIECKGNYSLTTNELLAYLNENNIQIGSRKTNLNCFQIAKDLRMNFEEIIWVSASLDGCVLRIEIKENMDSIRATENKQPCDIVAKEDGVVCSIITRSGIPMVKEGDNVSKGDLLVSGSVPILNDAKEIIRYQYVTADADVIVTRQISYSDEIEKVYQKKIYSGKTKTRYHVLVKDLLIRLESAEKKMKAYETHTNVISIKINHNIALPIVLYEKTREEYIYKSLKYKKQEMTDILEKKWNRYLTDLKNDDIEIVESQYQIDFFENKANIIGTIEVREDIGIVRKIVDLLQFTMVK